MEISLATQGWRQFIMGRKRMLDAFDKAREYSKIHIVQTSHGNVAEAEFRKWLTEFLPKKYGVTSGYIISQGLNENVKATHFDVIIYDILNSPVLWVEDDPDNSKQGQSLAIPAEYVKGVIEIKSAFKSSTVKDAIEHLSELKILMEVDAESEEYKKYLPPNFFCFIVFFELRNEDEFDSGALNKMLEGFYLRGFQGGIILRGENSVSNASARIMFTTYNRPEKCNVKKPTNSLKKGFINSDSIKIGDSEYISLLLFGIEFAFSQFAFDIIALLAGTYDPGRISSFHGVGGVKSEPVKPEDISDDLKYFYKK